MNNSRTQNSIRNAGVAVLGQICSVLLSFITRTIFIRTLGASYLGINGLFSNILTVLSFVELGIGTAIVYAMYKPLATNDQKEISALMNFYANVYHALGLFILIIGIAVVPLLPCLINDVSEIPTDLPPLWVVYVLYLLNSASSYFFNYKRTLVIASQNGYIDSLNQIIFVLIRNVVQIIILLVFKSFVLYLITQIACTVLSNISMSQKADKLFPYLKNNKKEKLKKESLQGIKKNIFAMAFHKLGSVIVSGTDNILISKFVGLLATGCYSNYTLLTSTVSTLFTQIMSPITASVGSFVATKKDEENYDLFKKLFFVNAYLAIFCSVCLAVSANPFIELIWGNEYVFPRITVALIMISFYLNRIRQASQILIDTCGLFWPIRWKSFIEATINLAVSILLAATFNLGINGVIIGTIISNITTNIWWEPYTVYKHTFHKPVKEYFVLFIKYFTVFIAIYLICESLFYFLPTRLVGFLFKVCIALVLPNVVMVLIFHKTDEYQYLKNIARNIRIRLKSNLLKKE